MEENEETESHFFKGLLIGGALGVLAGIFFAPKSGKELRSDIREKGEEIIRDAKEIYADATTKTGKIVKEARHHAREMKKEIERHLSETRQKAIEILARDDKKEGAAGESAKEIRAGRKSK